MSITSIPFLHDEVSRISYEKKSAPAQIRAGTSALASLGYLAPIDGTGPTQFDGVPVVLDANLDDHEFVVDADLPTP